MSHHDGDAPVTAATTDLPPLTTCIHLLRQPPSSPSRSQGSRKPPQCATIISAPRTIFLLAGEATNLHRLHHLHHAVPHGSVPRTCSTATHHQPAAEPPRSHRNSSGTTTTTPLSPAPSNSHHLCSSHSDQASPRFHASNSSEPATIISAHRTISSTSQIHHFFISINETAPYLQQNVNQRRPHNAQHTSTTSSFFPAPPLQICSNNSEPSLHHCCGLSRV
ncbi:hypothetical protein DEO72_LG2g2759 [Vigna unguiculata]|uniref:Uncharacterized protein n=1 Tax=Vigna unguiculata TaxID=3917 RepID=A0A4D6L1N9_VIGUN|nr:hypothetical protein DEO72_LG2g2759 [Vigna unguiculata]